MNFFPAFYILKQQVLSRYREEFPYAAADWKTFSSKDILQLLDSIEEATKERISEKWVYTHLKPAANEKLPRKDMLDILAVYCRFSSWEMFVASQESLQGTSPKPKEKLVLASKKKSKKRIFWLLLAMLVFILAIVFFFPKNASTPNKQGSETQKIPIKDFYTNEIVEDTNIRLFIKKDEELQPLNRAKIKISALEEQTELVVESPFYSEAKVEITEHEKVIVVKPDDYAMMLKAFIQSDIKDWEIRKEQLHKILSEDLEVLIHLPNSLGVEYMNKTEFSQKLIIPTKAIKNWEIIAIEQDAFQKIIKIRIKKL